MEERLLLRAFGSEYLMYRRNTGAFCPCRALDCGVPLDEAETMVGLSANNAEF